MFFSSLELKFPSKFVLCPPCCMARSLMAGNWWLPEVSRKSTLSLRPAVLRQKSRLYCSSTVGSCWCWGAGNRSSHLGIHKQTNACWSIPGLLPLQNLQKLGIMKPLLSLVYGCIYQCAPTTKYCLQLDEETLR